MKVFETINKFGLTAVLLMLMLSTCNTCNMRRDIAAVSERADSLQLQLNKVYTKEELDARMEVQGLETSKRMLYDQNAIVRTTVRPDDRMNEYDQQIKALEKKFKK
jgi:hypothetical protein